jgi:hypothetical protein
MAEETTTTTETTSTEPVAFNPYGEDGHIAEGTFGAESGIGKFLAKYPSMEAAESGMKNLNFIASSKRLERPAADADEATLHNHKQMVRDYMGTPDNADGYGIKRPEDIPEAAWDDARSSSYLDIMHEHNASPELVQALFAAQAQEVRDGAAALPEQMSLERDRVNGLITAEFGNETGEIMDSAKKAMSMLGLPIPDSGELADLNVSHTDLITALANASKLFSEDAQSLGVREGGQGAAGTYEAQAAAIKTDPANRYNADFNSDDPARQKVAQKEYYRLLDMAKAEKGGRK